MPIRFRFARYCSWLWLGLLTGLLALGMAGADLAGWVGQKYFKSCSLTTSGEGVALGESNEPGTVT